MDTREKMFFKLYNMMYTRKHYASLFSKACAEGRVNEATQRDVHAMSLRLITSHDDFEVSDRNADDIKTLATNIKSYCTSIAEIVGVEYRVMRNPDIADIASRKVVEDNCTVAGQFLERLRNNPELSLQVGLCFVCEKASDLRCKCKLIRYCSVECQRKDRKRHKAETQCK